MANRQFPPTDAAQGTPPNYTPQAWAVRYIAPARPVTVWNHDEWRKYGTRHHAEAAIRMMRHFPPSVRVARQGEQKYDTWKTTELVVELWEHIALSTGSSWYLHETRVYRDGEVFVG